MSATQIASMTAMVGIAGVAWLIAVIVLLSAVQAEFMRTLGWHPVNAPTLDWPSGLALGPYGWLMTTTFGASAVALAIFGTGSIQWMRDVGPDQSTRAVCPTGISLAAIGMCGLMFETDPTIGTTAATWHGRLHDASYVVLGIGVAAWMLCHARVCIAHTSLRRHAALTLVCLTLMVLGFVLKGLLFYGVFAAMAVWIVMHAIQIKSAGSTSAQPQR